VAVPRPRKSGGDTDDLVFVSPTDSSPPSQPQTRSGYQLPRVTELPGRRDAVRGREIVVVPARAGGAEVDW
jgi:hypothetical protein